jgi:hypothetical protein
VPVRFQRKSSGVESFSFQGNIFKVHLMAPQEMEIALFDLRGRSIKTVRTGLLQPGRHAISMFSNSRIDLSQTAYVAVVRCGLLSATFRWIRGLGSSGPQLFFNGANALAKKTSVALVPDTLIVSKNGYMTRKVFIANLSGFIAPITLYSGYSVRPAYISGQWLPGSRVAFAYIWKPDGLDTLSYAISIDSSGKLDGSVYAFNHGSSDVRIVFDTSSVSVHGMIAAVMDSTEDTLVVNTRKIFIKGAFSFGDSEVIACCAWKDGTSDSLFFPLSWDAAHTGNYSGTVLVPARSTATVSVTVIKTDSGFIRRLGSKRAIIDSVQDSVTVNCTSSKPVVFVGRDTLLGWGDTMWLHCTAVDSVDSIVNYLWQFSGATQNTSDTFPEAFSIVPMFVDSIYLCKVLVTDANNNTTQASLKALMTCSVRNFRAADNEVAGWSQTESFSVAGAGRINSVMSPLTPYFNTIREAAVQNMVQIDQRTVSAVIADLGSVAAASSLFRAKKASIDTASLKPLASFPDSVAVIDNSPADGIIAYAHFKDFFFQLTFGGFLYYSMAQLNAEEFISVYQQRAIKTSICRDK